MSLLLPFRLRFQRDNSSQTNDVITNSVLQSIAEKHQLDPHFIPKNISVHEPVMIVVGEHEVLMQDALVLQAALNGTPKLRVVPSGFLHFCFFPHFSEKSREAMGDPKQFIHNETNPFISERFKDLM